MDSTRAYLTEEDPMINVPGNEEDADEMTTLRFTIINDGKFFQDLELTITGKAEGFDDATATVTVRDDDQDLTLSVDDMAVTESGGEDQEVVVTVTMDPPRKSTEVPIMVTSNSARYSVSGDMVIEVAAGDPTGKTTLKITPVDNDRFDRPADIVISVTDASELNARTVKVTLTDDDETEPTLKLAASPGTITEDGGATQTVAVTATLDGDALQTATTVALKVAPENDRYGVSGDMEITISAGSKTGSTNLVFAPVQDGVFNEDLMITVTGSASGFDDAMAEVTLADDDQEFKITVNPSAITEDDGEQEVVITVHAITPPQQSLDVPLSILQGPRYAVDNGEPNGYDRCWRFEWRRNCYVHASGQCDSRWQCGN